MLNVKLLESSYNAASSWPASPPRPRLFAYLLLSALSVELRQECVVEGVGRSSYLPTNMGDRPKNVTIDGVRLIKDLKVVELKAELERRNLSKSGSKKELIERLRSVSVIHMSMITWWSKLTASSNPIIGCLPPPYWLWWGGLLLLYYIWMP